MNPPIQKFATLLEEAKSDEAKSASIKPINGSGHSKPDAFNFDQYKIDDDTVIPPLVPVVTINEAVFAYQGDISFVSGPPKSGKSTVSINMLATALMIHLPADLDTLGIRSSYCGGNEVVYLDSEQPRVFTNKIRLSVLRLANLDKHPTNFLVFNIREMAHKERRAFLLNALATYNKAHFWIIDGITDFLIEGANSESEGNTIIQELMSFATHNNTSIICMIHHNRSGDNLRGHIGAESERKSGGVISIGKDRAKQVHWIEPKYIRGAKDFEKVFFQFSDKENRFMSCDAVLTKSLRKEISPEEKTRKERQELAELCLMGRALTKQELKKAIINQERGKKNGELISERTAERRIKEMEEMGLIKLSGNGTYSYVDQEEPELEQYEDEPQTAL